MKKRESAQDEQGMFELDPIGIQSDGLRMARAAALRWSSSQID